MFKTLHLISMVTWFAGLFYIFRLFVYHVENSNQSHTVKTFKIMEYKLYYYITWPGMISTLVFGSLLVYSSAHKLTATWLLVKLGLVTLLVFYHLFVGYVLKRFKEDDLFLTSKQCRFANEFPTIILVSVIFIAVYRHIF